jgi:hypothetical protein
VTLLYNSGGQVGIGEGSALLCWGSKLGHWHFLDGCFYVCEKRLSTSHLLLVLYFVLEDRTLLPTQHHTQHKLLCQFFFYRDTEVAIC